MGMYEQIELSERGKAADSARNSLTKTISRRTAAESSGRTYDVLALCELRRNGHKSVEISRHYSIQHKDSSKTKRVTFAKGGDALCQRKTKLYV